MSIKGKVCVLSGTASGVGKATAIQFAKNGAKLAMIDWNAEGQAETDKLIEEIGAEFISFVGDTGKEEDVIKLFEMTDEKFGRIDFLANIAGIPGYMHHVSNCPTEMWDSIMATDFRAYFLMCKHAFPYLERNGGDAANPGGMIINVASAAGLGGSLGGVSYVSAKHGVTGLSKHIAAHSAKRGVYCNCICPGMINTPFNDNMPDYVPGIIDDIFAVGMAKGTAVDEAEDVAQIIYVFANDEMPKVNGVLLPVEGGERAW